MCTHLHLITAGGIPAFPMGVDFNLSKYEISDGVKSIFETMQTIHATKQAKPIMQDMATTFEDNAFFPSFDQDNRF